MDLELKECWFLILMIIMVTFLIGNLFGESKDDNKQNYSLGYAECKANMSHKYQEKADK